MWIRVSHAIGLFSLVVVLAGCGGEKDAGTTNDQIDDSKPSGKTQQAVAKPRHSAPAGADSDEPWGDLKMRFVYDGTVPTPAKLTVDKNQDVCTKKHPVNESLLVNKADKGIANVVVWLYLKRGEKPPEAHSSYAELSDEPVYLDNLDCRFEPHVTILPTGRPLVIRNKDSIGHNTKCDFFSNTSFNDQIESGGQITKGPMTKAEATAVDVQCSAHGWMQAKMVIKDHPYVAKSDASGNLVIPNLPKGTWTFQLFHERPGYLGNLDFETGGTDPRGRIEVEILPGVNDLGEIVLSESLFTE